MGCGLRSLEFGQLIKPKPSNQLSNNCPRQRHTPVDVSGPCIAVNGKNAKARAADCIP
jgi:hypothetical protein